MKASYRSLLIALFLVPLGIPDNISYSESTAQETLLTTTKLTCSFTEGVATRWTSQGPIIEKGSYSELHVLQSIDLQKRTAERIRGKWTENVRLRRGYRGISFFSIGKDNKVLPFNITTVFAKYHNTTKDFFAVLSRHGSDTYFGEIKSIQLYGTCIAED